MVHIFTIYIHISCQHATQVTLDRLTFTYVNISYHIFHQYLIVYSTLAQICWENSFYQSSSSCGHLRLRIIVPIIAHLLILKQG